jgi:4-carboxymuconolactone decarboxylase
MMARIRLITERTDDLSPAQLELYDKVAASRGSMIRPFEVLAHVPGLASPLSEVGAGIRYAGGLSDRDRELTILTAAVVHGCDFEWQSHSGIALEVGVRPEALDHLQGGSSELTDDEGVVVSFVKELCATSTVSDDTFAAAVDRFGEAGVVELSTVVGYYTLLAFVMGAVDAC